MVIVIIYVVVIVTIVIVVILMVILMMIIIITIVTVIIIIIVVIVVITIVVEQASRKRMITLCSLQGAAQNPPLPVCVAAVNCVDGWPQRQRNWEWIFIPGLLPARSYTRMEELQGLPPTIWVLPNQAPGRRPSRGAWS